MNQSPLFGRRIHITGSISDDITIAPAQEVGLALDFVRNMVVELMRKCATFIIPVDADKKRTGDNLPICFDWAQSNTQCTG